jgi:hypothetical protein
MATFASCSTRLAEKFRALDPAWRWALGVFIGARIFYSLWGIIVLLLVPSVLQNLDLFGVPLVAYFDVASGERFVFSRAVNGRVLTFRANDAQTLMDAETSSVWSLRDGIAVRGALAGTKLDAAQYTEEDIFPYRGVMPERGWFGMWQRFDVLWYQAIAERGYGATVGDVHFPPLYPLLESILGRMLGGRFFLAGWLISQIALVWSLALLFRITERWRDATTAKRAVAFTILFPTAFFFFTAYSEALFLLLTLLCFDALERARWTWAGFFVFLAILARLQGIALCVPLAYCLWNSYRATRKISLAQIVMLALPMVAGAFYLLLRAWSGDGNVLPTHEAQLNARLAPPWANVIYALQTIASGKFLVADILNLLVTALAIFVLLRGWRLLPGAFALYCAATLLIVMLRYVDTQPLNSMTRYVLTLFPLLMLLAYWSKNRWVERVVVYVCAPLNLYLTAQFLLWGWVA